MLKNRTTKKSLQAEVQRLTSMTQDLVRTNETLNRRVSDFKAERDDWRRQAELMLHTPEYKADVEAAFARGVAFTKARFKAFLTLAADEVNLETDDNNN